MYVNSIYHQSHTHSYIHTDVLSLALKLNSSADLLCTEYYISYEYIHVQDKNTQLADMNCLSSHNCS